jgi:hypothetical protein
MLCLVKNKVRFSPNVGMLGNLEPGELFKSLRGIPSGSPYYPLTLTYLPQLATRRAGTSKRNYTIYTRVPVT